MTYRFFAIPLSKWHVLTLCLLLTCLGSVSAQQNNDGGSIYSYFGLGELRPYASSQIQAMGGGGAAVHSLNYINFTNPATWSDQAYTRVAASASLQQTATSDGAGNTSRVNVGTVNAVQFGFPAITGKLGIAFAFQPYSRVNYRVVQRDTLLVLPGPENLEGPYQVNYEGNGGLQQIVGGVGYRLNSSLSIGASVSYVFGLIENARRTSFASSALTSETVITVSTRLSGVTGTVGVLATLPSLLAEDDVLSLGASLTLPASLRGSRVNTLGESLNRDTLGVKQTGATDLPFGANLGFAYQTSERWLFTVNGVYEPWSDFKSAFTFPGYDPAGASFFKNRKRLSVGGEVYPAGSDAFAGYLRRVAYRLGFFYDGAYITPPTGDAGLSTLGATAGLSLPTLMAGTRLDLSFEVGTRGSTGQNLVRDVYYRLTASVNIGERWFVKRKLR